MSAHPNPRPLAYSYIRMSSDIQLKGHSLQRQLQQSEAYAKAHGLELVEDRFLDKAVSAFRGANVQRDFGRFLELVRAKQVPTGSYLLVESLDRLSRQEPIKALPVFLDIINAGINVVTLTDGHEYRATQTSDADLLASIFRMSRAHEESATKSHRVAAAWENKRKLASNNGRPMTRLCPAWLRLSADQASYDLLPERVAIVRSIFSDTVSGIGSYVITNRLNAKRVPTFGNSKGWQRSYITKILANRAVLGEYQPHQLVDGKRKPIGDQIQNYFPRIIGDALFYRAQQGRAERRISSRGRKGQYLTNLFSGLATCAYCGSHIVMENKGPPPKGGSFLVCDGAKRGMGCVTTGWRYEQFEASFLAFVEKIDLPAIINDANSEKKALDENIQSFEGRLLTLQEENAKAYEVLKIVPSIRFVAKKMGQIQKELDSVQQQLDDAKSKRQALDSTETAFYESKDEIKELVARLQQHTPDSNTDLYKLRAQVSARIRAIVKEIGLASAGDEPFMKALIERKPSLKADLASAKEQRFFHVVFVDGTILRVYPNRDDPLQSDDVREIDTSDGSNPSRALLDANRTDSAN